MTFALQLLLLCSICYQSISTEQPLQSEEMVKAQVNSVADISGQPTFDSHTPVVISPESDESLSDELLGRITEHPQSVPPNGNNFVFQRDPYLHNNRPEQAVGNSPFNDQLQPHPQSHVSHDQWVRQPSPHRIIQERQPLERMPDPLQLGPPVPHAPLFNTFMNPSHYTPGREQMSRFQPENLQASDEFVSLTIIVHPAVKQCLYYSPATDFVIEYQVIRGGHLDIGLYIRDPDGKPVSMRHPSSDASIAIKVPPYYIFKPYAICLDNRKATYAEKYVALSVDLDIDWENPSAHELAAMEYLRKRSLHNPDLAENTEYVEAWKSLLTQLEGLFARVRRIMHLQQKSDNHASMDQSLMEANMYRVNVGSTIQMLIMLGVAFIQILLIRALFDPKNRFHRLWFGVQSTIIARC